MGLTRIPYLNFNCCNNVKLVGNGVIDLSHLDRRERRGIVFAYANNIEVDGIKIINSPEWSFITYDCENLTIKNVDIFGYRQNTSTFTNLDHFPHSLPYSPTPILLVLPRYAKPSLKLSLAAPSATFPLFSGHDTQKHL